MEGLAKQTYRGFIWTLSEQFLAKGIQATSTVLLAYFLSPNDFGLIAMLMIFISIAGILVDSGFSQALIRQKNYSQTDFNTAFYANLTFGVGAYITLFILAPYIAIFYEQPELTLLSRVVGLVIISNAFQVVQIAKLSRDMNFRSQFFAVIPASVISVGVALFLAYADFGVWVLVVQMLCSSILVSTILWWQKVWTPSIDVSRESLSRLFGFGSKLLLSGLLAVMLNNIYIVLIGKLFSAALAGLYFFADKVKDATLTQIVSSIQKATYPALSSLQAENERLSRGYSKIVKLSTYVVFPFVFISVTQADTVFGWILLEKWWPASLYFQLILLANILLPLHAINLNILLVKGRSDLFLKLELIKVVITLTALSISYRYGVLGILIAQNVLSIFSYAVNSFFSKRLIGYSVKNQIYDFLPNLLLAGFVSFLLVSLQSLFNWPDILEMFVFSVTSILIYVYLSKLLKLSSYDEIKLFLKTKTAQLS